jgi:hypothetical protein
VPEGGDLGCNPDTPTCANVTATDFCGGPVEVDCIPSNIESSGCHRTQTFLYEATDFCENSVSATVTYTWIEDTTPPQFIDCPQTTIDLGNYPAQLPDAAKAIDDAGTVVENCDYTVTATAGTISEDGCTRYQTWTVTATDECNPPETCLVNYSWTVFVTVDTWVYLEGAAVDAGGTETYAVPMRFDMNTLRILPGQAYENLFIGTVYSPPGQPYTVAPWNYTGSEGDAYDSGGDPNSGGAGYPPDVVDWVLVSLRAETNGTPLCTSAALLHADGEVEFITEPFECLCEFDANASYYVVIEHRNHLLVMSPDKVPIVNGVITYDFRQADSYNEFPGFPGIVGQKEIIPGVWAMYGANGDQTQTPQSDTDINPNDETKWGIQNGDIGLYRIGDYNLNADVNFNDRKLWEFNNGNSSTVPRN